MTLELDSHSGTQQPRKYSVAAEYRNRNDAKFAAVLRSVEDGALEFLKFRGRPPPSGYVPFAASSDRQPASRKRKLSEGGGPSGDDISGSYGMSGPATLQIKRQRVHPASNFRGKPREQ